MFDLLHPLNEISSNESHIMTTTTDVSGTSEQLINFIHNNEHIYGYELVWPDEVGTEQCFDADEADSMAVQLNWLRSFKPNAKYVIRFHDDSPDNTHRHIKIDL